MGVNTYTHLLRCHLYLHEYNIIIVPSQIILMSATFEASIFASYFARRLQGIVEEVPVVIVEGRMFNVNEFFLDDIKHIGTVSSTSHSLIGYEVSTFVCVVTAEICIINTML